MIRYDLIDLRIPFWYPSIELSDSKTSSGCELSSDEMATSTIITDWHTYLWYTHTDGSNWSMYITMNCEFPFYFLYTTNEDGVWLLRLLLLSRVPRCSPSFGVTVDRHTAAAVEKDFVYRSDKGLPCPWINFDALVRMTAHCKKQKCFTRSFASKAEVERVTSDKGYYS